MGGDCPSMQTGNCGIYVCSCYDTTLFCIKTTEARVYTIHKTKQIYQETRTRTYNFPIFFLLYLTILKIACKVFVNSTCGAITFREFLNKQKSSVLKKKLRTRDVAEFVGHYLYVSKCLLVPMVNPLYKKSDFLQVLSFSLKHVFR